MRDNVLTRYLKSSLEELSKVTWPTKNQAVKLTAIVLVFCLIVAFTLGFVDYGLQILMDFLRGLGA